MEEIEFNQESQLDRCIEPNTFIIYDTMIKRITFEADFSRAIVLNGFSKCKVYSEDNNLFFEFNNNDGLKVSVRKNSKVITGISIYSKQLVKFLLNFLLPKCELLDSPVRYSVSLIQKKDNVFQIGRVIDYSYNSDISYHPNRHSKIILTDEIPTKRLSAERQ